VSAQLVGNAEIREHDEHDEHDASVLAASEYALFAQVGHPYPVEAGQRLFRRGDAGDDMFVISSGEVKLNFGDDLVGKRLGPQGFFGELGLLIGTHVRSADAVATSAGSLLRLGRGEFDLLAQRAPGPLSHFLRRAIARVVHNEQRLIGYLRGRNQELQDALDSLRSTHQQLSRTEALTRTDELTGLANRRGLWMHIEDRRRLGHLPGCSLVLVDCDHFKAINDDHGHPAGDRVLQGVANLLRAVAGPDDMACRLGGDEFALLLQGQGADDVAKVAGYIVDSARILQRMRQLPPQMTTLSIGACGIGTGAGAEGWEDWYIRADTALYRAKRLGGSRFEWQD